MSTGEMGTPADSAQGRIMLTGWAIFGSVTLLVLGAMNVIHGFTALEHDSYFKSDIVYSNLTFWGWMFLIWGVLQMVGAGLILSHRLAGYYIGICVAGTAAVLWFFMMFSAPFSAMVGVIVSLLVVYALTVGSQEAL
jgi:hypothetical protein